MKTTSNERISHQPLIGSSSNFILEPRVPNQILILVEMKKTSNGRRHQNIKRGISQQPLLGFSSNFKLKLGEPNQYKIICLK
jgi:hypothetical protein